MDDVYGNKLLHPIDTSIEGKNFIDYTDARGYKLFQSIVNVIKEKTERFDEYYWYKPNTNGQVARKISFYKYFEPLNMAIGTGEYFEDFEKMIQKKALEYINMIKFGNSGYIFVLNYDGLYLSHIKKDYIGKNYIENKGISHIDFIKIDIEGHELKAFEGFGSYMNADFIDYIQFEYGGANLDSHTSLMELYAFFEKRNFSIAKIMPNGLLVRAYKPWMDNFTYSNYVAVSNKVLQK